VNRRQVVWFLFVVFLFGALTGCWGGSSRPEIVVNSLQDMADPPEGTVTIRDAIERINSGGRISFADSLSGGTIDLAIIGEEHSILKGEVFTLIFDPMPPHWQFDGYLERDYGASALYAAKNITIDASDLPDGITLNWAGGEADPARVLAVYGDLTMENVNISSGVASAVFLTSTFNEQGYTLARGGGIAVWGVARISDSTISGNMNKGESAGSRDRGAFGGGIYGDVLVLEDCVVAGNSVKGYGAAGGGVYSVGGRDSPENSSLTRCAVTGNRVAGQHTYGGGVYTDGGGRGNRKPITLSNCTIARNLVMANPDIPEPDPLDDEFYYRGGGVYMSNGYLWIDGCTIAENVVTGYAATFHGEPNMSGGGVAATVGDAHVVEDMQVQQSIIAGNTVNGEAGDLFTGSLVGFYSYGYNLIGDLNFDHILPPIPPWLSLSRKHYPKEGDLDGIELSEVLSLGNVQLHATILSAGADSGSNAVLWYPPGGFALDTIPGAGYQIPYVKAGFSGQQFPEGFLDDVLNQIDTLYGMDYSSMYGTRDLSLVSFYGPAVTWPSEPANTEWITFWRDLDAAIADSPGPLGIEKLADDFWGQPFASGNGPEISNLGISIGLVATDQLGNRRPAGVKGDIGAIEIP